MICHLRFVIKEVTGSASISAANVTTKTNIENLAHTSVQTIKEESEHASFILDHPVRPIPFEHKIRKKLRCLYDGSFIRTFTEVFGRWSVEMSQAETSKPADRRASPQDIAHHVNEQKDKANRKYGEAVYERRADLSTARTMRILEPEQRSRDTH